MEKPSLPWFAPSLEAFKEPLNWSALIIFFLLSLMVGKWEPLLLAGIAEATYLALAPVIPFFYNRAATRISAATREAFDKERDGWMARLDEASRQKAQALEGIRQEIVRLNTVEVVEGEGKLLDEDLNKIGALFLSYLRLLFLRSRYQTHLQQESPDMVRQELSKLEAEKQNSSETNQIIKENQEILRSRLEHLSELQALCRNLDLRLSEIENSFKLVSEQVAEIKGKGQISGTLNSLMAGVQATEEMARETNPILERLQQSKTL